MPRSESARERETHRYYQAWLESSRGYLTPDTSFRPHLDKTTRNISRDKALVALAQLGCLRLNVKRCIVMLISSSTSYVLAEATRTISMVSGQHANGDELWIGTGAIPRSQGISEHALQPPMYTAKSPDGQAYTAPALVISEMTLDIRSSSKEYVGHGVSFYAGVPITTKNGSAIGVYTVTDDRVREGLSVEELQFMQDIASTTMDHLENIRNDAARHRGERMVLGLGAFTEGQASMGVEEMDDDSVSVPRRTSSQASTNGPRQPDFMGFTITETDPDAFQNTAHWPESREREEDGAFESTAPDELRQVPYNQAQKPSNVSNSISASSSALNDPKGNTVSTDASLDRSPTAVPPSVKQSSMPLEIRQTFARAANIIRQATASDGVIFFDAQSVNVGNDYKAAPALCRRDSNDTGTTSDDTLSSSGGSSEDLGQYEGDFFSRPSSDHEKEPRGHRQAAKTKQCEMLGYSFRLSSVAKINNSSSGLILKEGEIKRFIRRYPRGLVMHFTKEGEVSSSDESSKDGPVKAVPSRPGRTIRQREKKRVIAMELIKVVPGARNVIFLPLFNFSLGRWSAGCFIWSSRPERLLNAQDDLLYMKAFANTIMGEVNRLEASASDQAKTSFVANISHELRSPLHGILGSIEFLQDTAVDPFQASMITTVETCGKTLLDTVNHVLDFAKLSKRNRSGSRTTGGKETMSLARPGLERDFDLAVLVEEVVEAIYAGQTFRSMGAFHGNEDEGELSPALEDAQSVRLALKRTPSKFAGAVRLLLDIERLDTWCVRTQPGAVRRIVMNLLGNSLKYTEKGLVCVALKSTKSSVSQHGSDLSLCLTVADTGIGMSVDFVKNHAWEAFSQEDSFANGVGLGLSIVRHLASSLGGKIDLQSSKGKGTELKILLTVPLSSATPDHSQDPIKAVFDRVKGLTLCILDPGHDTVNGPSADLNRRAEDTLRRLVTSWFGMRVVQTDSISGGDADFFMYTEPPSAEHMLQKHGAGTVNTYVPLIIITGNAYESANLRNGTRELQEMGRTIDIISQPVGPQKLARAFERCLYQEPFSAPWDGANTPFAVARIHEDVATPALSSRHQRMVDSDELAAQQGLSRKQEDGRTRPATSNTGSDARMEAVPASVVDSALSVASNSHGPPCPSQDDRISSIGENPDSVLRPILLVDDNDVNLKLLVAFVRKARYPYTTASDGLQALNLYKEASRDPARAFRAIVIDIQMPVMDGLTATREVRNFEMKKRIRPPAIILALTGLASNAMQKDCQKAGVDHFLPKPVKFKEFLKLLEE